MARVFVDEDYPGIRSIGSSRDIWRLSVLGLLVGLIYWLTVPVVDKYIISNLFCANSSLEACIDTYSVAGKVTGVLLAAASVVVMIKLLTPRPILVATAVVLCLWGLSSWYSGLGWAEALAWSVGLYILAYTLFGWLARHKHYLILLAFAAIFVAVIRIAAIL